VTNIFKHVEVCSCESGSKLGSKLTANQEIHTGLLRTSQNVVVIPSNLPNEEKRCLVRYLMANGEDVALLARNCIDLRLPTEREVNTPPKAPEMEIRTKKRKRGD
jgi:hypothetical protein